jgi:hypothetical protein
MVKATKCLKTRLDEVQLHHDIAELCLKAAHTSEQAAELVPLAWRWVNAGFRNKLQLQQLLRLEVFYNGGLFVQAERLEMIGITAPTYATFVQLLEAFDRG